MAKKKTIGTQSSDIALRFAALAATFAGRRGVELGGRPGFGSGALKVNGKIFAMLSSKQCFVVKLPKARVAALAVLREGRPFDPSRGRLMREWLQLDAGARISWASLAEEAYEFVKGA